ncbi:MAG TPA: nuclear transport factor 2 family protein [Microbacterium sp.]|uniref:nuclear transport factor 2 family protein n=1 Tax=Microbacterium sp. TaxID=51671 RepID=UPI002D1A8AF5|nr:nuclear transport factor 2 family protein [Microbacterium sp.]HWI31801.1 nuclear transport factor 2 family protein [Microbacterium sp.]
MSLLTPENRYAIADLNARFAWALDLHDFEALRDVFTADVHYVSVAHEFHDVERLIASFHARTGTRTTRHGLGNLLLAEAGDSTVTGRGSWHTFASNAEPPQGVEIYMVADFHDTYVRDAQGGWRIAERVITPVFREASLAPGNPPQTIGDQR